MRKIIGNSTGHNLNTVKFPKSLDFMCTTYASRKLIVRLSPLKIKVEPLKFLEKIQGYICGPIKLLLGSFRYFMVLIDASTRWSHVCLLSTCNHVFAKFMTQVIRLKVNFLNTDSNMYGWIILHNSLHGLSMIIVWLKELKCNIRCHMCTLKMVWLNLILR
jgi:hypothetical protein